MRCALWPAHCITPRNRTHGPTASRYWFAMMREIWCRCVRSCAAHVASSCDRVTVPNAGWRPRRRDPPASASVRANLRAPLRAPARIRPAVGPASCPAAVAHVPLAIERRKGLRLRRIRRITRARGIQSSCSQWIRWATTAAHAPCFSPSLVSVHISGKSAQQRVESRRRALKQRDRVFEILLHPNSPLLPILVRPRSLAPCSQRNNGLRTLFPGRCRWTVGIGLRPSRFRECQSHGGETSAWDLPGVLGAMP